MPPTPKPDWKVKLDIETEDSPGYTPTNVNGYWYKYTGGNTGADNGDIYITQQDPDGITFEVSLQGSSNGKYDIKKGDIKDSSTDISFSHPSGNKVTITDLELTNNEDVTYGITVNPKHNDALDIECDPSIRHDW